MTSSLLRRSIGLGIGVALLAHVSWSAETSSSAPGRASTGSSGQRSTASRSGTAKGPLPDPTLLDGGTQPVEKKSEYGMIGDFEIPGDENAKGGKVGGQQNQNQAAGSQGNNPQTGMPQGGGGGGGQESQQKGGAQGGAQGQQGGAQGGGQEQQGGQQAGGGSAGGPQNPNAAGNPVGGAGEAGGQPQGTQVAELGGNASGQPGAAGEGGQGGKPTPMAIGDKAMRIGTAANVPGVVGAQPQQKIADGHVQQHDKGTGTGGKAPTSPQGPGRIEKGRAIPAGL